MCYMAYIVVSTVQLFGHMGDVKLSTISKPLIILADDVKVPNSVIVF